MSLGSPETCRYSGRTLGLKGEPIMLDPSMRQVLLDAIASGPPYRISTRDVHGVSKMMKAFAELERRGLITPYPFSKLTAAGVAEAKWVHVSPMQRDADQVDDGWSADQRVNPMTDSCRSRRGKKRAPGAPNTEAHER